MMESISVECSGEIPLRRSFRSLVQRLVPACCSSVPQESASSTVTGTFFGHRKGRVRLCLQDEAGSALLLLELAVPTEFLAREMQQGVLRIALECGGGGGPLLWVPVWSLCCNGRKVGFAVRRSPGQRDAAALKLMHSVSVGAGVLPGDLMYLRATFHRVTGSPHSDAFHMINPAGTSGSQQLSIFFFRSS